MSEKEELNIEESRLHVTDEALSRGTGGGSTARCHPASINKGNPHKSNKMHREALSFLY